MSQGFDSTKPVFHSSIISSELRSQFNAIATHHAGIIPPVNPQISWIWLDTSNPIDRKFKAWNGTSWITIIGLDIPIVFGLTNVQELRNVLSLNTIQNLSSVPFNGSSVLIFLNGQLRENGYDFTISGNVINWISPDVNVTIIDKIVAFYQI